MQTTSLENLIGWRCFQKSPEGQRVFPSTESFRWYLRNNEMALVDRGAVVKLRGQWFLVRPTFDQAVIELATLKARAEILQWGGVNGQH